MGVVAAVGVRRRMKSEGSDDVLFLRMTERGMIRAHAIAMTMTPTLVEAMAIHHLDVGHLVNFLQLGVHLQTRTHLIIQRH